MRAVTRNLASRMNDLSRGWFWAVDLAVLALAALDEMTLIATLRHFANR